IDGPRVVVLHVLVLNPVVDVLLPVVALEEEPPLVSADGRLDDDDPFQGRSADGQAQCKRSWSAVRRSAIGTRTCVISSRDRMVAAWSFKLSKSMVTANGVPISSWRR